MAKLARTDDPMNPFDPKCQRFARTIKEYDDAITDGEGWTVRPGDRIAYVRFEEGTYNPTNGHFLCDHCYVAEGMPSSPSGWRCP